MLLKKLLTLYDNNNNRCSSSCKRLRLFEKVDQKLSRKCGLCGVTLTAETHLMSSDHSVTIVIHSFQQDQNKGIQSSVFDRQREEALSQEEEHGPLNPCSGLFVLGGQLSHRGHL